MKGEESQNVVIKMFDVFEIFPEIFDLLGVPDSSSLLGNEVRGVGSGAALDFFLVVVIVVRLRGEV